MNRDFRIKLLQNIAQKKTNQGFTLIELLVVVIMIGVLASIALPNLLSQIAKARQAEAKNNLGAINRAQQAYNNETGVFAPILPASTKIPVKILWQYYNPTESATNATSYTFSAAAVLAYQNDLKNYASAVAKDTSGNFTTVICESLGTASASGTVTPSTTYATIIATPCTVGNQIN